VVTAGETNGMRWGAGSVSGDMTRTAVLALLARQGPLSRAEIAAQLELSPAAVTMITRKLLADGLLMAGGPRAPQSGRPSIPLALVPGAAHAIGVQIARDRLHGEVIEIELELWSNRRIGGLFAHVASSNRPESRSASSA